MVEQILIFFLFMVIGSGLLILRAMILHQIHEKSTYVFIIIYNIIMIIALLKSLMSI